MKSLKQLREDSRVHEINKLNKNEFTTAKYEISLADGYTFDGESSLEYAESVTDLNELVNNIK